MAENKNQILSSLRNDVEEIKNASSSKFGSKTKTPSGKDPQKEINVNILTVLGGILGTIYGIKTNEESKIPQLLDKDPKNSPLFVTLSLFSSQEAKNFITKLFKNNKDLGQAIYTDNVKKFFKETFLNNLIKKLRPVFNDDQNRSIADLISSLGANNESEQPTQKIEFEVSGKVEDLTKLIDELNKFESNKNSVKDIQKALSSLNELVISFNKDISDSQVKRIKDTINALIDIVNDNKFKTLFENLYNAIPNKSKTKIKSEDLLSVISVLNTIVSIGQIENIKKHNVNKNLEIINNIVSDKGIIKEILKNIKNLGNISVDKDTTIAISNIVSIFKDISESFYISPLKILKLKISIKLIKTFLVKDFINLIDELSNIKELTKEQSNSITVLRNFVASITEIVNIPFKNYLRAYYNLDKLQSFIFDIQEVFDLISTELTNTMNGDMNKSIQDSLETIKNIKSLIEGFNEFNTKESSENIDLLNALITNELTLLISNINSLAKEVKDNVNAVELIQTNIDRIKNLLEGLPSFKDILLGELKLSFIEDNNLKRISGILKKIQQFKQYPYNKVIWDGITNNITSFNSINAILSNNQSQYELFAKILDILENDIIALQGFLIKLKTIENISKSYTLEKTQERFNDFNGLPFENLPKINNLVKLLDVGDCIKTFNQIKLANDVISEDVLNDILENIKIIVIDFDKNGIIGEHVNNLAIIDNKTFISVENIIKFIDSCDTLIKKLAILANMQPVINKGIESLGLLFDQLKVVVDKLNEVAIEDSVIKNLDKAINSLFKLVIGSAMILIFVGLIMKFIPIVQTFAFAAVLCTFVTMITWAYLSNAKNLNVAAGYAEDLGKLVLISGFVLILGGLLATSDMLVKSLVFGMTLSFFIWCVTRAFITNAKDLNQSIPSLKDLTILVVASSLVIILAGKILSAGDVAAAIFFTITLGLFIAGLVYVIQAFSDQLRKSLNALKDVAVLVIASGLILLLAGNLIGPGEFFAALFFAVELAAFIFGVLTAIFGSIALAGKVFGLGTDPEKILRGTMRSLRDVAILVVASGLVMILAGALYKFIDVVGMFLFTATLGLFIAGMIFTLSLASKGKKVAFEGLKDLATMIAVSAAVMIVGGMFLTWFPEIIPGLIIFTSVLAGFIISIGFACKLAGKGAKENIKNLSILLGITALSAIILLIGGTLMAKHPDLWYNVGIFTLTVSLYMLAMTGILFLVGKLQSNLIMGLVSIGIIVAITALCTLVFTMVGEMAQKISWGDLMSGIGQINVAILLLGGAYWGFGYLFFLDGGLGLGLAALALTAINGLTFMTTKVLETVSNTLPKVNLKTLDILKAGIIKLSEVAKVMIDQFGSLKMILILPSVSLSVSTLAFVITQIARAVQEYANLEVGEDFKPNKFGILTPTKYRKLTKKDFKEAANNIKQIVTVLGSAIIDVYNQRPDIFETNLFGNSPFMHVTKSMRTLGPMINEIAKAVKDYSSLVIGDITTSTVDKDGRVRYTKYVKLDKTDFEMAAANVNHIISTLGYAVIACYETNPEIFETNFWGTSKFAKVTKSLRTLGPMINSIASAVKDYASLRVGSVENESDYTIDPKTGAIRYKKYRELKLQDFSNAADNVKLIMNTLGGAIIAVYEEHPDYYETSGGILGFGAKSPFTKTISANMKLANLITSIAGAVKDYANLTVAENYVFDSKSQKMIPTKMRELGTKDFSNAANNVKLIMDTLGKAIIELYEKHPDYYETSGGIFGIGGSSPFSKVVSANMKLADLISSIGRSVKDFANFKIATDYKVDKDGKAIPTGFEPISDKHFQLASRCIQTVLNTLGKAVLDTVNSADPAIKEAYKEPSILGFSVGKSPFIKVVKANMVLADLISKIGKAVVDFSAGKVPTGYDAEGKATGYEPISEKHFKNAATNISKIITTLGSSVMFTANKHKDWFEDGEDSEFAQICTAIGTMGDMINSIAKGIQAYADLKMPDFTKLDEKGNPTYKALDDKVFDKAGRNISKIVTNLGSTICRTYDEHEDWFEDGPDSKFMLASTAIASMGEMLSNIANGMQAYADLRIPIKWDSEGRPIDYKPIDEAVFTSAGNNIGKIVSVLGKTIMNLYDGKSYDGKTIFDQKTAHDMFEFDPKKQADSIFNKVVEGCSNIGEMISSISEGIQAFASLNMPTGFDKEGKPTGYKKIDDKVFTAAGNNIATIISVIGRAIDETFYAHKSWFTSPPLKKKGGFLGLMTVEEANPSDPPFIKAVKGCALMGGVIASISEGVQKFAASSVPQYDETGKVIGYTKMDDTVYTDAANAISQVITIMGTTLDDIYNKHYILFTGDKAKKITDACVKMGSMIGNIARGIQTYANMRVATDWDENGKPIKWASMTDSDFTSAAKTIKTVLTTIADAIAKAADHKVFSDSNGGILSIVKGSSNKVTNMLNATDKASGILGKLAGLVGKYALFQMPDYSAGKDENGQWKKWIQLDNTKISDAIDNMGKVISALGEGISGSVNIFKSFVGDIYEGGKDSPIMVMASSIEKVSSPISTVARVIGYYATGKFPIITMKDGKATYEFPQKELNFNKAKVNIINMIDCLASAINDSLAKHPDLFNNDPKNDKIAKVNNGIKAMGGLMNELSNRISEFVKADLGKNINTLGDSQNGVKAFMSTILQINDYLTNIWYYNNKDHKVTSATSFDNAFGPDSQRMKDIKSLIDSLSSMTSCISGLYSNYGTIYKDYNKNQKALQQVKNVQSSIESIVSMFLVLSESIIKIKPRSERIDPTAALKAVNDIDIIGDVTKEIIIKSVEIAKEINGLDNIDTLNSNIQNICEGFITTTSVFTKDNNYTKISLIKNGIAFILKNDVNELLNFVKTIRIISNALDSINSEYFINTNDKQGKLLTVVKGFNDAILEFKKIFGENGFDKNIFGKIGDFFNGKKSLDGAINSFANSLSNVIDIAKYAEETGSEGFEILEDGIDNVNSAIKLIQTQEFFENHNKQLDKYIKTINNLNVSKVNKLNALVTSMNILAQRLGNVDKLTDAIAESLASELDKLTRELTNAKSVINKADDIQKKRHELIKKQVKDIKEMMDKSLMIEIRNVTDDYNLEGDGGSTLFSNDSISGQTPSNSNNIDNTTSNTDQDTIGIGNANNSGNKNKPVQNINNPSQNKNNSKARPNFGPDDIALAIRNALSNTHWKGSYEDGKVKLEYSN